jgi:hypothetical protein
LLCPLTVYGADGCVFDLCQPSIIGKHKKVPWKD